MPNHTSSKECSCALCSREGGRSPLTTEVYVAVREGGWGEWSLGIREFLLATPLRRFAFRCTVMAAPPGSFFFWLTFGANEGMKQAPGNKLFRVTLWGTYETAGLGGWLTPYTIGYEAL